MVLAINVSKVRIPRRPVCAGVTHSQTSLWSFPYFEVNEFVPVSFATSRALDVIPGVAGDTSDAGSRSNDPANLLEWSVTFGT